MNPFPYSDNQKRYHSFDYFCRRTFGKKMAKLPVNLGLSCPNLDGSKGVGGCIYCSAGGGDFCSSSCLSVSQQLEEQRRLLAGKWKDAGYIAYFQAHTNTYAPARKLLPLWEEALRQPGVGGISIATRADCLAPDILAALEKLRSQTVLSVELGLQSVHDRTAGRINRCHTYAEFLDGLEKLRARSIPVCVHLINGLPGESREDMLESARQIAQLDIQAVKIHLLHVLRGTRLESEWLAGNFPLLSMEEYISIVCDQLEEFPPELVIQRLTGDGDRQKLIGPLWSRHKRAVLNGIDMELARRNSMQGLRFKRA